MPGRTGETRPVPGGSRGPLWHRLSVAALGCALLGAPLARPAEPLPQKLSFVSCANGSRALDLAALGGPAAAQEVRVDDPVYRRAKRYAALPMKQVLERGFDAAVLAQPGAAFQLIAADGYTKSASAEQLCGGSAFLAFRDAQAAQGDWEPLEKGGDPGPFYLVWTGAGAAERPWPYQLIRIEQDCSAAPSRP